MKVTMPLLPSKYANQQVRLHPRYKIRCFQWKIHRPQRFQCGFGAFDKRSSDDKVEKGPLISVQEPTKAPKIARKRPWIILSGIGESIREKMRGTRRANPSIYSAE